MNLQIQIVENYKHPQGFKYDRAYLCNIDGEEVVFLSITDLVRALKFLHKQEYGFAMREAAQMGIVK